MMKTNRLYWRISTTLLLLMAVVGVVYVLVSGYTARNYFQEVNQRLYGNIAYHMVKETKPLVGGKPDTLATHVIMHSLMVINPSVEVYLLDTTGKIIDYVVPNSTVKLEKVSLGPVKEFIASKGEKYVVGDDPKSPGEHNVFSAAPVFDGDKLLGYAYIILAGEEYKEVTSTLLSSYFLKSGMAVFLAALAGSLLIGLVAIWLITRNLQYIIQVVRRFKEGDRNARIENAGESDLSVLATTFNDMADTIVANIEELKSVENLRRELIANVSHDLRTPLSIIQGYVETLSLKNDQLSPEDRERYLQIVLNSSEKLSNLISQLFEYSRLEANQIQPQKEPFFIGELAQDIFQKFEILARNKKITFNLEAPKKLPLVFADVRLVERVIQNLIDNALKFTPEGGSVTVSLQDLSDHVEVRIADTGPGIPADEQSFIFERYRRAPAQEKKSIGSGLGLAIAKKILELHDSSIQVQSKLNEGAAFKFQLPVHTG